ncbi:hypothetical protein CCP4SC76_30003 [Gammaproteobacteria bacterium]
MVANHYDILLQGFYDENPLIPAAALRELYGVAAGGKFSTKAVAALIAVVGIYPVHSAVLLNTGERGVVTKVNWQHPLKPAVMLRYNTRQMALSRPFLVDLARPKAGEPERMVQRVIDPTLRGEDPAQILMIQDGKW